MRTFNVAPMRSGKKLLYLTSCKVIYKHRWSELHYGSPDPSFSLKYLLLL